MKKTHEQLTLVSAVVCILLILSSFTLGYHIGHNNPDIPEFSKKAKSKGVYSYLAIGNSITLHGITDFWWGNWGMAASKEENDYYHRVVAGLKYKYGEKINTECVNYYLWEVMSNDRSETYNLIDPYLVEGIDLISVQLSDNVSDLTTFETDFSALLKHIREKCGDDVQIIVIDDFWSEEKSAIKRTVCEKLSVPFIALTDIRGIEGHTAGMGTLVEGADGTEHRIEHLGVANHPGDEGMKVIAEKILEQVFNQ